jgi:hypothetical protein
VEGIKPIQLGPLEGANLNQSIPKNTWKSQRFGDWFCLRPQVCKIRGGVEGIKPTQLGPLEGANLNYWTCV